MCKNGYKFTCNLKIKIYFKVMGGLMIIKRLIDLVLSLTTLVVFFPFLCIISVVIYFKLGSPIFFTQNRVGKNGKIFKMIKFRSMLNSKDKNGNLLSDDERLTVFGKTLRSTSLDELPELINVIKRDMSLVGPRPLLVEYKDLYSEKQFKRHDVLPGLTGWAQVNGRNSISWGDKFELDVWYVENWGLWLDVKIVLKTVVKVFKREGISQGGKITIEKFTGFN